MIEPSVVVDKLNCLSVDDLYLLMKSEGVTGVRQAAGYCVVANYLKRQGVVRNADVFGVCPVSIVIRGLSYDVSPNLSRFILRFDHGEYPDLSVGDMAALDRADLLAEMTLLEEAL